MAPLTSTSGCPDCSILLGKIHELEERITTMHRVREAELLMDTITFRLPSPRSESTTHQASLAASTDSPPLPLHDVLHDRPDVSLAVPPAAPNAAAVLPGDKPKSLATSTPAKLSPRPKSSGRVSVVNFTPAPRRHLASLTSTIPAAESPPPHVTSPPHVTPPLPPVQASSAPPRPLFPPTTIIIGDSITRNIRFFNAITYCFPGATVPLIHSKLVDIVERSLPPSVRRIIVHVGCVDAFRRQSEITKVQFNNIFQFLRKTGKTIFISGPLSPHNRGYGIFSRILSLHTWLQSATNSLSLNYIDNFDLFWGRKSFFNPDGLHPSKLGSRILTVHLQHAVHSA
uniref:uncharacterized protein LOC131129192 isoform X1 n=1 Tax=Doryrhamphus excisus TaxID=161450 RepID=UPI0025AE3131|nr:uncharacterized protein LOC131129192 isoform X1 [Doryrhamphus excisus]XP_057928424.1 uncharacterized protein LOC131129192 isoform X1 [Doryrhamphus excisus]XP_057928425.1 uncharacterized protein LOC131129192 isoform X1 [Doryrhamphus excisus]XP_057928426.1 uncharacterized protein LOC131129192 isoform X1 [Doryrhamphus excisus]